MKSDININNKDCLLNWKEFEISRLFTIKSPAARTIKSYSEGKTPYVSSGSFNNGIAKDELGIEIDTNQFFEVEDFVKSYDANGINAPINCDFLHRESEFTETCTSIINNKVTILTGASGIGKTRLALEVCRQQDNGKTKVFCVKSNGNFLYEDIKYYISDSGKYLIFFDDVNMVVSLDNVLDTILTLPTDFDVKLLFSVRDYAKERVIDAVSRYVLPNIIEIGRFKDDEIKDILKSDLEIVNPDYLKKIAEIANGNIRLAFLAGMRSINDGYQAIRNAEDIFKNYYGRIIDEAKLTKEDILMLFFISIAGPVKHNENQLYSEMKNLYGKKILEDDIIENLYSLELVDWFKNEITKIADQSFGNYILYYVLFEKRWISVENLISIGFPTFRNKIVYTLNTLMEIFHSKECAKYIEDSIIAAWDNAPSEQNIEYLESFYQVDPDKALFIIKNHINQEANVDFDLRSFDINSKKNYYNITIKVIEILGGYREQWNLNAGLNCVFEIIEGDTELYLEVLKSYFDAKAPFSLNGYRQIKYLLDHIGYEATYCFINNEVFAKKDEWMAFIWECMPEETIDEKIINDYKTFVFNNLAKDKPIVPAVQVVARYCERDSKLKAVVIKAVLTNPQMSANFLSYVYDDVAVEGIINFFENDIIALASIYMSAIENNCHIDYDGKLFKRIFEQHPTVWNEYVDWIKSKDTMCGDGNEHKIIELIWGDDKWRECVEYAFKVLIDDDVIFHIKEPADMLFTNTTDETILERKKYWLIEKLRETSLELKKCKKLIEMVVNVLPDWKLEYILEFLKINKNPEDFKEIPLFPSSYSWSGSEIPLIMEKIDFLKSLKDNIKGINFIEHRKYIEEYRMNLERYKDNVELREYLENADYA